MTALHFPSAPLPAPCGGCGGLLCAECARSYKLTAVHFGPQGICAFGHRVEVPLVDRLTAWIKDEGIEGNYPPDQIAARIVSQCHASNIERWLTTGHDYLRGMCRDIKDWDHLTLEERAAENYWHGHGTH